MTAKEFLKEQHDGTKYEKILIDFAIYHVKLALQAASEDAEAYVGMYGEFGGIKKESILKSYPLENIN